MNKRSLDNVLGGEKSLPTKKKTKRLGKDRRTPPHNKGDNLVLNGSEWINKSGLVLFVSQ